MKREGRTLFATAFLLILLFVLNGFLSIFRYFPEYEWQFLFIPIPEVLALVPALLLSAHFLGGAARKVLFFILAILFFYLFLSSLLEAFFLHVYKRPFRLFPNLPLASHFFNMLFRTDLFFNKLLLFLPFLLVFLLFTFFLYLGFLQTSRVVIHVPLPPAISVLAVLLLIGIFTGPKPSLLERAINQWKPTKSEDLKASYQLSALRRSTDPGKTEAEEEETGQGAVLSGIGSKNIHLFIVESYGMTVYENPHHFGRIKEFLQSQQEKLRESGFSMVSYAYESTAFGGTSWLADASLLSGIEIDTQEKYDKIIGEGTRNLLHFLDERGYYTILSAPGTKFMTPKYRDFYRYHRYVIEKDFVYQGPYFAYGAIPDQYQLYQIHTKVLNTLSPLQKPYFAQYILCSSHTPWHYIPPYLERWSEFDEGKVYNDRSKNTWYENSWVLGSELFEGYIHSIRYSLESVFGFAHRFLGEEDILIITGDHQPKFPVSEKGASFAVPLHIISKNENLLAPLTGFGYVFHIVPPKKQSYPGIEEFLGQFISLAKGGNLIPRPSSAPLSIPR